MKKMIPSLLIFSVLIVFTKNSHAKDTPNFKTQYLNDVASRLVLIFDRKLSIPAGSNPIALHKGECSIHLKGIETFPRKISKGRFFLVKKSVENNRIYFEEDSQLLGLFCSERSAKNTSQGYTVQKFEKMFGKLIHFELADKYEFEL